jgi:glycosyltransferase involved in cell wall biosynthesis
MTSFPPNFQAGQLLRSGKLVVLHIVQALRGGGAQTLVREVVPRLRSRGVDARVLCAYGDSQLTAGEMSAWHDIVYCERRAGVPRLRYIAQLRTRLESVRPALVHTHTHSGSIWGRTAAVLSRVPAIIHTEHDSVESFPPVERIAVGVLSLRTDAVVVFSDRSADVVRRREKVAHPCVIPNGIKVRPIPTAQERQIARTKLGGEAKELLIGVVASLEPYKNPALALESLACVSGELREKLRLLFFGEGSLRSSLATRSHQLGIAHLVRFLGFRDDLPELLPGLDIVLSTSSREMMPISFLEAMNNGVPIIGTPHGGTLDLVKDRETGIVLGGWDRHEVASAIEWVAVNRQWRIRAAISSHQHVLDNFDIEKVSDRYLDLYAEILNRKLRTDVLARLARG